MFVHGADYTRTDPDGAHVRLNVSSILKDKATGAIICYQYTGVVNLEGPAGKVLSGSLDAATTPFGDSCQYYSLPFARTLVHANLGV